MSNAETREVPMPAAGTPLEYAGWGRRLAAYVFDSLFLAFVGVGTAVITTYELLTMAGASPQASLLAAVFAGLVAVPSYFALNHGRGWQTPGERLFGIAVRDARTVGQIGYGRALGRAAATTVGYGLVLDWLWPLWDRRGQALHDKVAGTVVVRVPRPQPRSWQERFGVTTPTADVC